MRRTIKSEDSSNIKRDTYVLKAADPFFDCDDGIKINHILKFHPGDKEALDHYGHEWLLRRDVPPKPEENENKPRRKSKYYENTGLEPDQTWKQPLLLTGHEDSQFLRAFTARREKNERSKLDTMLHVTLTEVSLHKKSDSSVEKHVVDQFNRELADVYKRCMDLATGPGTDVYWRNVSTKKRVYDESATYTVTDLLVRVPTASAEQLAHQQRREQILRTRLVRDGREIDLNELRQRCMRAQLDHGVSEELKQAERVWRSGAILNGKVVIPDKNGRLPGQGPMEAKGPQRLGHSVLQQEGRLWIPANPTSSVNDGVSLAGRELKSAPSQPALLDLNGQVVEYREVEAGSKSQCWMLVCARASGELMLEGLNGDWWTCKKEATRCGVPAPLDPEKPVRESKKKAEAGAGGGSQLRLKYERILNRIHEGRSKTAGQGRGNWPGGDDEDEMRQTWREENHTMDDDMDCQQCGDMDDDDYDMKLAAAGDDLGVRADDLQKMLDEEEAPEEMLKQDAEEISEEEDEAELDEDGRQMDLIIRGIKKPKPAEEDKDRERERDAERDKGGSPEKDESQRPPKIKKKKDKGGADPAQPKNVISIKLSAPPPPPPQQQAPPKRLKVSLPSGGDAAGGGGPRQPPTEAEFRETVGGDAHMCTKKLVAVLGVKGLDKAGQAAFQTMFKALCIKTKKTVPDGPYAGEAVIALKPPPAPA